MTGKDPLIMDIVIVGSGKVGFSLAEQLVKEEHNVTVVDSDEEALRRAGDQLDIMTVRGNGVSAAALREAGWTGPTCWWPPPTPTR